MLYDKDHHVDVVNIGKIQLGCVSCLSDSQLWIIIRWHEIKFPLFHIPSLLKLLGFKQMSLFTVTLMVDMWKSKNI